MESSSSQKKVFAAFAALAILFIAVFMFFRFTDSGQETLWSISGNGTRLLPLVAVAAIIDSVNPCAFSILLITLAFLFSLGRSRSSVLTIGGTYIFGVFLAYLLIGIGFLQALHLFGVPHFMAKVGAGALLVWGILQLINHFFPAFPVKLRVPAVTHQWMAAVMERASIPAALALGMLVGLCEFPCTGGPYLMVIGLLHDAQTYASGVGFLLLYNVLFVAPLILLLGLAGSETALAKLRSWQRANAGSMRLWGGILMVVLGISLFFL